MEYKGNDTDDTVKNNFKNKIYKGLYKKLNLRRRLGYLNYIIFMIKIYKI